MSLAILKSTFVVSMMTLISRISGLIRDNIFAQIMGSQLVADIFFVAFRLPNFFRRLFGEGAFSAAFIPVYADFNVHHSADDNKRFLELVTGRLMLSLLFVTAIGVIFAPALITVIAPGFRAEAATFALAVDATRIMFPYLFFISLVALSAGILNTNGKFAVPAFTPIILNICLILGAWFFAQKFEYATYALALSVIIAGFLQLAFQLPFLRRAGVLVHPRARAKALDEKADEGARQVYNLILPAVFGVSVAQINLLINTLLASFMVTGSISWLYYSDRLMEFPVGVFGIALATAILPKLSKDNAQASGREFARTLDWSCRLVFLISVPAMLAFFAVGEAMVTTIYQYGAFTNADVHRVYQSLLAFALGILPIILIKVLAPGFYAQKNTKTPVKIGIYAMIVNIVFSLILFTSLAHVGLALATSIAAFFNASALFLVLKREGTFVIHKGWLVLFLQILFAALAMVSVLYYLNPPIENWLGFNAWQRTVRLLGLVFLGALSYGLALLLMGLRPRHLAASHLVSNDSALEQDKPK